MEQTTMKSKPQRLLSLDVFRGLTVAAMILVNNPGDYGHVYSPLEHAPWNGCTPTDLIFPFFLYIVGVSIAFALEAKKVDTANHSKLIWNAFRRMLILFGLGFFLALFPAFDLATVRIPGVLQRISVVFFICALVFIKTDHKFQIRLFWSLLLVYYVLMAFVPVPGFGPSNLNPGTNLGAWLDRAILTPAHLYKQSKTWDPEGILSTMPAVATGIFGMLIGSWLKRKDREETVKVAWMFTVGTTAVLLGLIFNEIFPINKSLWTSSYVLYAGGLSTIGLALLYWVIDIQGYRKFSKPFVVYGVNAITVFFLSGFIVRLMNLIKFNSHGKLVGLKEFLYQLLFAPYFSPVNASLAGAFTFVLIWLCILWLMYNKNIIIKV